ncbi:hypothetical protein [Helicobacter didelphidarum]|nr:hypothetical protein [Helicobacter didelphidarum]
MKRILLGLCLINAIWANEADSIHNIESSQPQAQQKKSKDLMAINALSVGVNLITGSTMGANVEFGFPLLKKGLFQWRNYLSVGGGALKLNADSDMDTNFLLFSEKMTFGVLSGSSLGSHAGFSYFHPYLFIGGGFGLLNNAKNAMSFGSAPYYYEVVAGIGHDFMTANGHSIFFEFGGGYASLTQKGASGILGGFTRVLLGYRFYF